MVGRFVAALALLVSGLVLGSAAPAAACSCERLGADEYVQRADYAFTGTTTELQTFDSEAVYRFSVDRVYLGQVHRTQDVVTPLAPGDAVSSCEERLPLDARWLMLGTLDDEGRLTFGLCRAPAWTMGDPLTGKLVTALGSGAEPLAGTDLVEADGSSRDDVRRTTLGVLGLAAIAALAVVLRRRRARRSVV